MGGQFLCDLRNSNFETEKKTATNIETCQKWGIQD